MNSLDLDIVIPVYNEGDNIIPVLDALQKHVLSKFRVFICYDFDEDNTLSTISAAPPYPFEIILTKNTKQRGLHGAVITGFEASTAPAVMMMPADDQFNAHIIDKLVQKQKDGIDVVCPSRFVYGSQVRGYPWLRYITVRTAAFILYHMAFVPVHDPTNGFRLFSRRTIDTFTIESTVGGTFSIELMLKCHRMGWPIAEIPASWYERSAGVSRFRFLPWIPHYLAWLIYGFKTTYFFKGAGISNINLKS